MRLPKKEEVDALATVDAFDRLSRLGNSGGGQQSKHFGIVRFRIASGKIRK